MTTPENRRESSAASSRREAMFVFRTRFGRLGRFGAALSRLLLPNLEPCYGKHGHQRPIAWNFYRCTTCAALREPERWWHRLGWWLTRGRFDPFGRSRQGRNPW